MSYKSEIKTLQDLISFGVSTKGCEDNRYLYLWANDPNRDFYDSSLFRYDKNSKTLERIPSELSLYPELDSAVDVDITIDYLKKFL